MKPDRPVHEQWLALVRAQKARYRALGGTAPSAPKDAPGWAVAT